MVTTLLLTPKFAITGRPWDMGFIGITVWGHPRENLEDGPELSKHHLRKYTNANVVSTTKIMELYGTLVPSIIVAVVDVKAKSLRGVYILHPVRRYWIWYDKPRRS